MRWRKDKRTTTIQDNLPYELPFSTKTSEYELSKSLLFDNNNVLHIRNYFTGHLDDFIAEERDTVAWSKHKKINDDIKVVNILHDKICNDFGLQVIERRVNMYDHAGFKPQHQDRSAHQSGCGNVTIGVSIGDSRVLKFMDTESAHQFSFDQTDGDMFLFTDIINKRYTHGVPPKNNAYVRYSVIFWGYVPYNAISKYRNSIISR